MKEALRHFSVEKEQRIQLSCIKKRAPVVYRFVEATERDGVTSLYTPPPYGRDKSD